MSFCANCEKNDGTCYTSIPPKYKCTIDNSFHNGMDGCNLYDRGYQQGRENVLKECWEKYSKMGYGFFEDWLAEQLKEINNE